MSPEDITPTLSGTGRQNPHYIARVGRFLPHFPADVLGSWFAEHLWVVPLYFPLGFENFRFEPLRATTAELGGADNFREGARPIKELLADIPIAHGPLLNYWRENGTWPVPPIVLNTAASMIPPGFVHPLKQPYHLLEGHHRLALAIDADANGAPIPRDYWIVRIIDSNADEAGRSVGTQPDETAGG